LYYTVLEERSENHTASERMPKAKRIKKDAPATTRLPGKRASASRSEMVEVVLPNDANPLGAMLGGKVMHLMDIAGALAAHRHSNSYVVTAAVDYVDFRSPVQIGEVIVLKSSVNRVFNTSMEVGVKIYSENYLTNERRHTSSAYLTFVAVDEQRRPIQVPPVIPDSAEDRRRFREAGIRRRLRLSQRRGKISRQ
jgi:acyl-CoA hydrolase